MIFRNSSVWVENGKRVKIHYFNLTLSNRNIQVMVRVRVWNRHNHNTAVTHKHRLNSNVCPKVYEVLNREYWKSYTAHLYYLWFFATNNRPSVCNAWFGYWQVNISDHNIKWYLVKPHHLLIHTFKIQNILPLSPLLYTWPAYIKSTLFFILYPFVMYFKRRKHNIDWRLMSFGICYHIVS
jgi:hypothetical protein